MSTRRARTFEAGIKGRKSLNGSELTAITSARTTLSLHFALHFRGETPKYRRSKSSAIHSSRMRGRFGNRPDEGILVQRFWQMELKPAAEALGLMLL